jgi:hypothetical protein
MPMALVVTTLIKAEPVKSAAMGVPIMRPYRPYSGLTPASTPEAMASGIDGMAAVNPASRSAESVPWVWSVSIVAI